MTPFAIFLSFGVTGIIIGFIVGFVVGLIIGKPIGEKLEEPEVHYVTNTQSGGFLKITGPLSPLEQKWIDTGIWKYI